VIGRSVSHARPVVVDARPPALATTPVRGAIITDGSAPSRISRIPAMDANDTGLADRLAQEGYGDARELSGLLPDVYADLKRIAHRQLFRHVPSATLSTTVLVHETWSRLAVRTVGIRLTREHFLALCARVMRQVIVDGARRRNAGKRGGDSTHVEFGDDDTGSESQDEAMLELAAALESLQLVDPRLVRLIEQHWFIGLEAEELAPLHGVALRTMQRELKRARAWLSDLLSP
jgi:RNA polymerase sigma factor (TIGR02999 family)